MHQGLRIEGNTITDTPHAGIHISSASGVTITGNTITNCCQRPQPRPPAAIGLENATDVKIGGNVVKEQKTVDQPILIGPGCQKIEVK